MKTKVFNQAASVALSALISSVFQPILVSTEAWANDYVSAHPPLIEMGAATLADSEELRGIIRVQATALPQRRHDPGIDIAVEVVVSNDPIRQIPVATFRALGVWSEGYNSAFRLFPLMIKRDLDLGIAGSISITSAGLSDGSEVSKSTAAPFCEFAIDVLGASIKNFVDSKEPEVGLRLLHGMFELGYSIPIAGQASLSIAGIYESSVDITPAGGVYDQKAKLRSELGLTDHVKLYGEVSVKNLWRSRCSSGVENSMCEGDDKVVVDEKHTAAFEAGMTVQF